MSFVNNKILYVSNEQGEYIPFYTVDDEVFLTSDMIDGFISYEKYQRAVKSPVSETVTNLYLLNEDESIKKNISNLLIDGNIDFSYTQGTTRSANITLRNENNDFSPSPTRGTFWKGTKFRIDIGLYYEGDIFWKKCGIFTPSNPTIDESAERITMQLFDKFSLLDGTLGGKRDSHFKIPSGTSIRQAIQLCLSEDKGNGQQYDYKSLIFPFSKEGITTPYTITKDPNSSIGEIIIELANIISCDVYYNEVGNLTLSEGVDDIPIEQRGVLWYYTDKELLYRNSSIAIDFSKVINKIVVVGSIVNGQQYRGVAENTSPRSQSNIYITEPNPEYIEDGNIVSNALCLDRAKYELKQKSMLSTQLKFDSVFIPNLLHNCLVAYNNKNLGISNKLFIINSVSFGIVNPNAMSLSLSNVEEVPYI